MERNVVKSSNIKSVGYDEETEILEVEFKSGGLYQYKDVPKGIYDDFMSHESHGKYLAESIKNVYKFEKIDTEDKYEEICQKIDQMSGDYPDYIFLFFDKDLKIKDAMSAMVNKNVE